MRTPSAHRIARAANVVALLLLAGATPAPADDRPRFPDLLLITVDTLRADRLSSAGYERPTSPQIDRLLASGFRFTRALSVEPLTNPALTSLITSLPPHRHGATRNGLPARSELTSLPRLLARRGYRTAAFVGNWTLKPRLSGLAEHWETYSVVVSRKRWFGLFKGEATARDLTTEALAWLDQLRREEPGRPYFLWLHYVEPHAPYRLHERHAVDLGIDPERASPSDRYDTEIAQVDAEIGHLLSEIEARPTVRERLTVFTVDHGEAFGEDGEFGHGRRLHPPTLLVPLVFVAPERIPPGSSSAPVSTLDVAPTLLSLIGLPAHPFFYGRDTTPAMRGERLPEATPCLQAHRGAVQSVQRAQRARRAGLLEVGLLVDDAIETLPVDSDRARRIPLAPRPGAEPVGHEFRKPSAALTACLAEIRSGLEEADRFIPPELDDEAIEQLRALGYLD